MIDTVKFARYCDEYGLSVSEACIQRLDRFAALLMQKNERVNLTAIKDPEEIAQKHLLDSLLVFKYAVFFEGARVIDVGCGAGFPSFPMLLAREDLHITFLDSTAKKLAFIHESLEEFGLQATVLHARAEEEARKSVSRETYDFAVARAVANLRSLAELTLPFVKTGGYFLALKGKEGEEELAQAETAIQTLGGEVHNCSAFSLPDGSKRTIIIIKKISQTPPKYPRASTAISKKPL